MSTPNCPQCGSVQVIRKGVRQNQFRPVQLYRCNNCGRYFSATDIARAKYPARVILNALRLYHLGYPQEEVARLLASKHHIGVPQRTISSWIKRYASLCTFGKLRAKAIKLYKPGEMIAKRTLQHRQVYAYQLHRAKLDLLGGLPRPEDYHRLRQYLHSVLMSEYPDQLFATEQSQLPELPLRRSSQLSLNLLPLHSRRKQNVANQLAGMGLLLAKTRKQRHAQIQNFMLTTDSATLACELPVYLTDNDVLYYQRNGFHLPISPEHTPVTGHIDILQVRQGLIHILDYKPGAGTLQPLSQLTLYALALASRTRLPLKLFRCAWFDEADYFEFDPLAAVNRR